MEYSATDVGAGVRLLEVTAKRNEVNYSIPVQDSPLRLSETGVYKLTIHANDGADNDAWIYRTVQVERTIGQFLEDCAALPEDAARSALTAVCASYDRLTDMQKARFATCAEAVSALSALDARIALTPAPSSPSGGGGGGGGTTAAPTTLAVEAENGGLKLSSEQPEAGEAVTVTPQPAPGFVLLALTATDEAGNALPLSVGEDGSYAYTQPEGAVTLTAQFAVAPSPFSDTPDGSWYQTAAGYAAARGLMDGTGGQQFSPVQISSRAMLTTVLWRLAGEPASEGALPFTDLSPALYYTSAVCWAAENGLTGGYPDGRFGGADAVTREQAAVLLYRFALARGLVVPADGATARFSDAAEISPYAQQALDWAVSLGLLNGRGDGVLAPQGLANRAELAVLLMRFCLALGL